jgi:hypothetical protein
MNCNAKGIDSTNEERRKVQFSGEAQQERSGSGGWQTNNCFAADRFEEERNGE